ncbi:holo-ACP synthase [Zooshikella sp. RANM57]|uniref:holo-ACP synthase n=1 Tax=Zooshikella sp. RANM57 TaxID=3425863 RepID=UPI003D6F3D4E
MIIGVGTDIVKIERIADVELRLGARFARRILTPSELQRYQSHPKPTAFLAKRFAVKEAAAKALGTGIAQGVSWQHIHINNNDLGAPILHFSDRALIMLEKLGGKHCHVSLADEQDYVVAFVVLSA